MRNYSECGISTTWDPTTKRVKITLWVGDHCISLTKEEAESMSMTLDAASNQMKGAWHPMGAIYEEYGDMGE